MINIIKWINPAEPKYTCIYGQYNKINGDTIKGDKIISFKKIHNILHSPNYDICYHISFVNHINISNLLKNDFDRISLMKNNTMTNPRYLLITLSFDKSNKIIFNKESNNSYWVFDDGLIKNIKNNLYLGINDDKLILSQNGYKWNIAENYLEGTNNFFITCDVNYDIYLTKNKNDAIKFIIENNMICYIKPDLRVKFEINNAKLKNFNFKKIKTEIAKVKKYNVALLLAGGNSTRFNSEICKQLYIIRGKPAVLHSVDAMIDIIDYIIIITNDKCVEEIKKLLILNVKYEHVVLLINNFDCRLESISAGLKYINTNMKNIQNIIIHDAARCFIDEIHVKNLLLSCDGYTYSQYYLTLVNGLYKKDYYNYEEVDRSNYIELVTPLCMNFYLCYHIFMSYIQKDNRIIWEFVNILNILKLPYSMIEGHNSFLRKLTTIDDVKIIF